MVSALSQVGLFFLAVFLFHFANAAMLPALGRLSSPPPCTACTASATMLPGHAVETSSLCPCTACAMLPGHADAFTLPLHCLCHAPWPC